jgi:hypothetical protein
VFLQRAHGVKALLQRLDGGAVLAILVACFRVPAFRRSRWRGSKPTLSYPSLSGLFQCERALEGLRAHPRAVLERRLGRRWNYWILEVFQHPSNIAPKKLGAAHWRPLHFLAPRPGLEPGTYGLTGSPFTLPGCPRKSPNPIQINSLALHFVRSRAAKFRTIWRETATSGAGSDPQDGSTYG